MFLWQKLLPETTHRSVADHNDLLAQVPTPKQQIETG
jgi:hypothetical protein